MKTTLANILIATGVLALITSIFLCYLMFSPSRLSFKQVMPVYLETSALTPKRILIKSIHVDLPVIPSQVTKTSWETTTEGVSFLKTSAVPGETGNSVLYGHNWASLLKKLPTVLPGQSIQIIMNDGSTKKFLIEHTAVVSPEQTSVIKQTNDTRLTLYTCTGFLDMKRFVVVAKPV